MSKKNKRIKGIFSCICRYIILIIRQMYVLLGFKRE